MPDRLNETELLALIEGEAHDAEGRALRERLSHDPEARDLVDRMKHDREYLRSLPEPELPMDFLAQIEALLARPMLIEPVKPGAYRRQQHRQTLRRRLVKLATAAAIALSISGGVWLAANSFAPSLVKRGRDLIASWRSPAQADQDSTPAKPSINNVAKMPAPQATIDPAREFAAMQMARADGDVHHQLPQPVPMDNMVSDSAMPAPADATADAARTVQGPPVSADFAVIVSTNDAAAAEQALQHMVVDLGAATALVRNFSYAEARRIDEQVRLAEGAANRERRTNPPSDSGGPVSADADKSSSGKNAIHPMNALANQVRKHLRDLPPTPRANQPQSAKGETSGQLAGTADHAPSLEQQLDFSSRGATHTVAVPAWQLSAFLAHLSGAPGQTTTLQMLPAPNVDSSAASSSNDGWTGLTQWLQQAPRVKQAAESIARDHGDSLVFVPVIVRDMSAKK